MGTWLIIFDFFSLPAHSIILDALRGAGEMGLTLDTLASIIGAVNQEKLVIKRLYDLQNRGKVLSLPNNAWKIKLASGMLCSVFLS